MLTPHLVGGWLDRHHLKKWCASQIRWVFPPRFGMNMKRIFEITLRFVYLRYQHWPHVWEKNVFFSKWPGVRTMVPGRQIVSCAINATTKITWVQTLHLGQMMPRIFFAMKNMCQGLLSCVFLGRGKNPTFNFRESLQWVYKSLRNQVHDHYHRSISGSLDPMEVSFSIPDWDHGTQPKGP